jgi:hypothetical protein
MRIRPLLKNLQRKFTREYEIWLVDDEERWHNYIRDNYGKHPDFITRTFKRPEDVLKAIDDGYRPDILLIDIFFANEEVNCQQGSFDQELEKVGETADDVWKKYCNKYRAQGLPLATLMHGRNIPACLYSAKGAPLFPSSTLGQQILQVMRHTNFLVKATQPSVEEREQILRLIREQKALKGKTKKRIYSFIVIIVTAFVSGYIGHHWEEIGNLLHKLIDWIF